MPKLRDYNYFMVFDVESKGLYGEGFAFGYVVIDRKGIEKEQGIYAVNLSLANGTEEDKIWVEENVLPTFSSYAPTYLNTTKELRDKFWHIYHFWSKNNTLLVADCSFPVEANFLIQTVLDDLENRKWKGPYPLSDLNPILSSVGEDNIGTFERLPSELPIHNPLTDARQSARVLIECLERLENV